MIDFDLSRGLSDLADEALPADLESRARRTARVVRTRRVITAAVTAIALVAAGISAYALVRRVSLDVVPAHSCVPRVLPVPPGGELSPTASTDPTGRYVIDGNILWTDGVPQLIPGSRMVGVAVNAHGVVTGYAGSYNGHTGYYNWIYRDGIVTMLGTGPGGGGYIQATGIDLAGDVAGIRNFSVGPGDTVLVGVVWPAGDLATPHIFTSPPPQDLLQETVRGMNEDGDIIGAVYSLADKYPNGLRNEPYVWRTDGTGHALDLPAGYTAGNPWTVRGDWAMGSVVGPVYQPGFQQVSTRWNLRTGKATAYPGIDLTAVDSDGDLLAASPTGPYVLHDGTRIPLALPAGADPARYTATSVSDHGQVIIGTVTDGTVQPPQPVIWKC